jgi:5-methyltetrahydrofolate--homocysteine methyltransferase
METRVTSAEKEVIIGDGRPTVLIGERINPSANKKLAEALRTGDIEEIVRKESIAQVDAGADMVDVNVGSFGVDEVKFLPMAVKIAMEAVDVPLCIDSANPEAVEAALKIYKGKPLVNSVSGESHSLERVLPLVREYGAAVVGLVQDDEGVPKDADRRVKIAHTIIERAEKAGIKREDVLIDCLAFAVGADTDSGPKVLGAIRRVRTELGVNQTLGASNISFGLPDRSSLNNAFAALIIEAGVTCLITNVRAELPVARAVDLILGRDRRAMRYVQAFRMRSAKS